MARRLAARAEVNPKKKFQVPTRFRHTVSETNLHTASDRYEIDANAAFVILRDASGCHVSIPRRVFDLLVEYYESEALPNLRRTFE